MTTAISDAIYAFIFCFVLAALVAGNVDDLNTAAHVVAWGGIVLPFGAICFAIWVATRPGINMVDFLRPIANQPERPLIEVTKMVALTGLLIASGWLFAAFAFLSLEISSLVMLFAINRFVTSHDTRKQVEGVAVVRSAA